MTIAQFCDRYLVRLTATPADSNPNMVNDDWAKSASHWKVRLYSGASRRSYTLYFSQGSGHTEAPAAVDVLDCLQVDAGAASSTFEDWASDMGYDTDSRQAEGTYRACVVAARRLKHVFGQDGLEELLACDAE